MPGKNNICIREGEINGTTNPGEEKTERWSKNRGMVNVRFYLYLLMTAANRRSGFELAELRLDWQCLYWDEFSLNSWTDKGPQDRMKKDLLTRWPQMNERAKKAKMKSNFSQHIVFYTQAGASLLPPSPQTTAPQLSSRGLKWVALRFTLLLPTWGFIETC